MSVYIRVCLSRALCISNCIILFGLNAALLRVALFEQNIGSSHGRAYLRRYSVALSGVLRRNWRTIVFRRSLFFLWYRHSERVFKGMGRGPRLRHRRGKTFQPLFLVPSLQKVGVRPNPRFRLVTTDSNAKVIPGPKGVFSTERHLASLPP